MPSLAMVTLNWVVIMRGHLMLFLVPQFQIFIWGVDCSLFGEIGLP